jgi:hypothetical protein
MTSRVTYLCTSTEWGDDEVEVPFCENFLQNSIQVLSSYNTYKLLASRFVSIPKYLTRASKSLDGLVRVIVYI